MTLILVYDNEELENYNVQILDITRYVKCAEETDLLIFLEMHFNVFPTKCHSVFHCIRS